MVSRRMRGGAPAPPSLCGTLDRWSDDDVLLLFVIITFLRVGRWYDSEGTLVPEEPVCIGRAHELVAQSREVHPGQFDAFEKRVNGTSDSDSEELR